MTESRNVKLTLTVHPIVIALAVVMILFWRPTMAQIICWVILAGSWRNMAVTRKLSKAVDKTLVDAERCLNESDENLRRARELHERRCD